MRTSSRLSPRRSPSASNSVLSFQFTSPSSSISSANGSASCIASLDAIFLSLHRRTTLHQRRPCPWRTPAARWCSTAWSKAYARWRLRRRHLRKLLRPRPIRVHYRHRQPSRSASHVKPLRIPSLRRRQRPHRPLRRMAVHVFLSRPCRPWPKKSRTLRRWKIRLREKSSPGTRT